MGVNVDHVATLRQARVTTYPDPVAAALEAERAGADAITIHLREDRRHIQEHDVLSLQQRISTRINLELAVTDEMLSFAEKLSPADCCFVPERREELTTEGGLDVAGQVGRIAEACERMTSAGVRASLFIDPEERQLEAAVETGAPVVEIHTGRYADAENHSSREAELDRVREAVTFGHSLGLHVNAGHGLNYDNVQPVSAITEIRELNIGHAIVAQAVFDGMFQAVTEMKRLMRESRC